MVRQKTDSEILLDADEKRKILLTRITVCGTVFACIHAINDFAPDGYESTIIDLCIAILLFGCYLFNRNRKYAVGRNILLLSMNIGFVFYASVVDREVGVFLYYFPLMAASATLYGPKEKLLRYSFIILSFACLGILFATDFNVLGVPPFPNSQDPKIFLYLNIFSTSTVTILCINFMLQLNETSENSLQKLAAEVKAKNEDLEKANTELDRFLYSTSHDLRSPLSSIKGLINVARYDNRDSKIAGYFDMMTDRVNRLESFIKDIIDYSKNERTDIVTESVDLNLLVSDVIDNLKFVEGADTIRFEQHINIDHPVQCDKTRLSIILNNLVANAIKYHDPCKENRWISITTNNSNGTVKLIVADNGTGIKEEYQEKIFDMFYRGTLLSSGSGLGLYIVKQAVEKMNGRIAVNSESGQGSTFFVTVPLPETPHQFF
jgi:signal transduction histidine kinase